MSHKNKSLFIQKSTLPGAGNGLFTKEPIKKGTRVIQYVGKKTTWEKVSNGRIFNAYVFFISPDLVIDARTNMNSLGRFANDARGLQKIKGINNNCIYTLEENKVFIDAIKNIPAGGEILVPYGKEYWDTIKENQQIEGEEKIEKERVNTSNEKVTSKNK